MELHVKALARHLGRRSTAAVATTQALTRVRHLHTRNSSKTRARVHIAMLMMMQPLPSHALPARQLTRSPFAPVLQGNLKYAVN